MTVYFVRNEGLDFSVRFPKMSEQKTLVLENTSRRDALIDIEEKYQKLWEEEKIFEQDAPETEDILNLSEEELHKKYPKFMATMAYPYMNGVLHVGHAFTLSKAEFAVGYQRMLGKRALFPLGFHCTGLPIKAAADKLKREIELFGENFDQNEQSEESETPAAEEKPEEACEKDVTKFKSSKSKANAKQGSAKYQYEIMLQLGIPREEIHKFADANYWIVYFPPLCERDCRKMGARIDWRRSMVTTDYNPYYDAFVRWQMNSEYAKQKIKFGKRYTIFSPKDNQACMDHDRSSGEGAGPQEYVALKILITKASPKASEKLQELIGAKKVYLVAATLRPETMYGQTCCFTSSKIDYGVFPTLTEGEYIITTERAYKNMSYQDLTPKRGVSEPVMTINGSELFGAEISAPLAEHKKLHVLPMETILATKGTGVVTCVPSDSPDDYITTQDIRKKPEYYGVEEDWLPAETIPVLNTSKYGNMTAKYLVEELKIQSPKDKEKLAEAKELAYKEGFYNSTMAIGPYAGEKVDVAKPKIRDELVADKLAFLYSEPEKQVVSRSGDSCVVSLEDQWYSDYGEETWRKGTEEVLKQLNTYSDDIRNQFEGVLAWMKQWALSRTYGLGSHIPWDPQYLVESLSDSTVYMAYYTIAHLLHSDVDGHKQGPLDIPASALTDEVWDYIFTRTNSVSDKVAIPKEKLDKLRGEFRYFYPLDLRVSAKDLIGNHLTMCLYVHQALFPKEYWPRSFRVNGHLLINGDKMSKSTGNFLTLNQMLSKYGSDASRIALADAGDSAEDANLDESSANAAILRLHNLKEWLEQVLDPNAADLREEATDNAAKFFDDAFNAEMDEIIRDTKVAYEATHYRAALKRGLFDLQISRDYYRDVCNSLKMGMNKKLINRYAGIQALLMLPIAPHFADYIWRELLHNKDTIQNALFPTPSQELDNYQRGLIDAVNYVREVSRSVRETEGQLLKKKKKGPVFDTKKPSKLTIYVALQFPEWQDPYVNLLREKVDSSDFKELTPDFKKDVSKLGDPKRGMQLVNTLRQLILADPEDSTAILDRKLTFNEPDVLKQTFDTYKLSAMATNIADVQIIVLDNGKGSDLKTGEAVEVPTSKPVADATPGKPGITIVNLE